MSHKLTKQEATGKFKDGMTVMIGGFLTNGTPETLVDCILESGAKDLTVICNDTGYPDKGVGKLLSAGRIKKLIASYIGTTPEASEQMNSGALEIEFTPQGTLAEKIRAGGFGLGGFLTPTGLGTIVAEGKQIMEVDGKQYLLEKPLRADIAIIGASKADETGNLIFRGTSKNFNPLMATAADVVICEAKEKVKDGEISPEEVNTPGMLVDFILE